MILSFLHHYINKNSSATLKQLLFFSLFFILPKLLFGQSIDDLNKKELRKLVSEYAIKYDSLLELNAQLIKTIESKELELNYKNETLLKCSVDLKLSNEKNDSLLKCIGSLNKEIDSLKLYTSNEDKNLFLVYDNYMFIDSTIDTNTFKGDYFFKEESGVYTLLSKIDDSFLKPQFIDLKKTSLCFYDSSMNKYDNFIDSLFYFKKLTPHIGTIEEWNTEPASNEAICSNLKGYGNEDYLVASFKNPSNAIIASKRPQPLFTGQAVLNDSFNSKIMSWITKQKETIEFQKEYHKYKSGYWWKDENSVIDCKLYMMDADNYWGITTISFDGSSLELEDNPYFGTSLAYIYSIKNYALKGICYEGWGVNNHCAFFNNETMRPYLILNSFGDTVLLCTETNDGWGIINSIEVGYYDCPY